MSDRVVDLLRRVDRGDMVTFDDVDALREQGLVEGSLVSPVLSEDGMWLLEEAEEMGL